MRYLHPYPLPVQCIDTSHSVLGIIAIPGMMTGAILGGSSVQQAARLQMVIIFMISASTTLASITTTILALSVVVDTEQRVRTDRIDKRPHAVWRARDRLLRRLAEAAKGAWRNLTGKASKKGKYNEDEGESLGLLG